ncbi:hypothetical protein BD324DRAFT_618954 [Kockovaella imperatae]|uniref:Uncharacterized protein n=1 Tax=Kockovaella imperatae TaxID=4999 RepID=A0A1Y1UMM9_9TREE|nr:hypothetical protein BD324DRAFT_618954 [Kockovaella imperatae]ORX39242.1 hypothetical protein BD324DRAFT_618954 [Kockovaella imperatae]
MSNPPKYETLHRDSLEETSLLSSDAAERGLSTSADPSLAYPPRHGESSTRKISVTYTFTPRYPVPGSEEHALAVLGETREESARICQRAFPTLADYPIDRIEFSVALKQTTDNGKPIGWGKITEDAWESLLYSPPERMMVRVIDAPGDAERRESCSTVSRECPLTPDRRQTRMQDMPLSLWPSHRSRPTVLWRVLSDQFCCQEMAGNGMMCLYDCPAYTDSIHTTHHRLVIVSSL